MAEVAFHPAALREYLSAVAWYRERNASAAERLVAEVDAVLAQIAVQPDRFAWYDDEFREAVLLRFPYSLIYRIDARGDGLVMAVAHASREPGYWHDRV